MLLTLHYFIEPPRATILVLFLDLVLILDLRSNGRLTPEQARLISEIEPDVRGSYTKYVGRLAKANNTVHLDWLTKVLSRNTLMTAIHDNFCRLTLFSRLLENGELPTEVLVDTPALASVLYQIAEQKKLDIKVVSQNSSLSKFLRPVINLVKSAYLACALYSVSKIVKVKGVSEHKEIIYLDNFLFENSFDDAGNLNDRYYPGLLDWVDSETNRKIFYAPTYIGIVRFWKLLKIRKQVANSREKFLLMEDWLRLTDYFKALKYSFSLPNKIRNIPKFDGLNVEKIVLSEAQEDIFSPALFISILKYFFIARLAYSNVPIKLFIDWNENQVVDWALNLAAKKYYSSVSVRGYQGNISADYYCCQCPTVYEKTAGLLPDKFFVLGEKYIKSKRSNCPDLDVGVAPAFRYASVHSYSCDTARKSNLLTIFVVLPHSIVECNLIMGLCKSINDKLNINHEFHVRRYPTYKEGDLLELVSDLNQPIFKKANLELSQHLKNSDVLISTYTSYCVEAVALGVPVVIAGSLSGPTLNPIPTQLRPELWTIAYTGDEAIHFMLEKRHLIQQVSPEIAKYFERITKQGVDEFLRV